VGTVSDRTEAGAASATGRPAEFSAARYPVGLVAHDDILDGLVALWTAERIVRGEARTLPEDPPVDRYGLRMEMVY
jgi:predicted RNase H-like nuclease